MSLKYPNSNINFSVAPLYFLGDFDIYDREETLGEKLKKFDPNDEKQFQMVMDEYFFKGVRATGLTAEHKAELIRVLANALMDADFDFMELVAHERDPDDCFTLPDSWRIYNPRELFVNIYILAIKYWKKDLDTVGLNPSHYTQVPIPRA